MSATQRQWALAATATAAFIAVAGIAYLLSTQKNSSKNKEIKAAELEPKSRTASTTAVSTAPSPAPSLAIAEVVRDSSDVSLSAPPAIHVDNVQAEEAELGVEELLEEESTAVEAAVLPKPAEAKPAKVAETAVLPKPAEAKPAKVTEIAVLPNLAEAKPAEVTETAVLPKPAEAKPAKVTETAVEVNPSITVEDKVDRNTPEEWMAWLDRHKDALSLAFARPESSGVISEDTVVLAATHIIQSLFDKVAETDLHRWSLQEELASIAGLKATPQDRAKTMRGVIELTVAPLLKAVITSKATPALPTDSRRSSLTVTVKSVESAGDLKLRLAIERVLPSLARAMLSTLLPVAGVESTSSVIDEAQAKRDAAEEIKAESMRADLAAVDGDALTVSIDSVVAVVEGVEWAYQVSIDVLPKPERVRGVIKSRPSFTFTVLKRFSDLQALHQAAVRILASEGAEGAANAESIERAWSAVVSEDSGWPVAKGRSTEGYTRRLAPLQGWISQLLEFPQTLVSLKSELELPEAPHRIACLVDRLWSLHGEKVTSELKLFKASQPSEAEALAKQHNYFVAESLAKSMLLKLLHV